MQFLLAYPLLLLIFPHIWASSGENPPVVTTSHGRIIGTRLEFSPTDPTLRRSLDAYLGIPYAEAPVGPLRLKPPVAKSWSGEIKATALGNRCLQPSMPLGNYTISGPFDEDCLVLDVIVPRPTPPNAAVLVHIHGGGYIIGAGIFWKELFPTALPAIGDVILVTINYRLGALGFLSTNDDVIPGNMGMLDQRLALEWVRDNIKAFGGDPKKVAVFGESAGGSSVGLHMISPGSAGLFHSAILESGDAAAPWASRPSRLSKTKAFTIGKLLGCERETSQELLECLQKVEDGNQFVLNQHEKLLEAMGTSEVIIFGPVADGDFLPAEPDELYEKGAINDAVSIIGSLADEGMLMFMGGYPNNTDQAPFIDRDTFDAMTHFQLSWILTSVPAVLPQMVKVLYGNASCADSPDCDYLDALSQITGDVSFVCSADKTARAFTKAGRKVYRYHIEHISTTTMLGRKWTKAIHGDDLIYVFGLPLIPSVNWTFTEDEARMSIQIIKYWTNLAKTGNPNLSSLDGKVSEEAAWPVFTLDDLAYKDLSPDMKNKHAIKAKECLFWNEVAPQISKLSDEANACKVSTESDTTEGGTCTKDFCPEENPNLSSLDGKVSEEAAWPVFTLDDLAYKDLSPDMKNKHAIKAKECIFWNEVAPQISKLSDEANACKVSTESDTTEGGTCTKDFCPEENPNLSSLDGKVSEEAAWPVFTLDDLAYKDLSPDMKNKHAIKAKECIFWNEVAPQISKLSDEANACKVSTESDTTEGGTCTKDFCPEE